jgi:hypothetical protein
MAGKAGSIQLARVSARDSDPLAVAAAEGVAVMDIGDRTGE